MNISEKKAYTQLVKAKDTLEKLLVLRLSKHRSDHSFRVARLISHLAAQHKVNILHAEIAGLGHDIARELDDSQILNLLKKSAFTISKEIKTRPILYHGLASNIILQEELKIREHDILFAIEHHTLGTDNWNELGKLLFVADYAEPGRKYLSPGFTESLDYLTIDEMIIKVCDHALGRGKKLHKKTHELYIECKRIQI